MTYRIITHTTGLAAAAAFANLAKAVNAAAGEGWLPYEAPGISTDQNNSARITVYQAMVNYGSPPPAFETGPGAVVQLNPANFLEGERSSAPTSCSM